LERDEERSQLKATCNNLWEENIDAGAREKELKTKGGGESELLWRIPLEQGGRTPDTGQVQLGGKGRGHYKREGGGTA